MEVDASLGEGGGQVLRTSLSLSAILGERVTLKNIRAKRPKPGLQPQHLAGVLALEKITGARVTGAKLCSRSLSFEPNRVKGGVYSINIGTAGSVTLLIQTILPPLLFAEEKSVVRIVGGTDVEFSPPFDYTKNIFIPAIEKMGARVGLKLLRRGYFPKGGGVVVLEVEPLDHLRAFRFPDCRSKEVSGVSHCGALPSHVAERQARAAASVLEDAGFIPDIETEVWRRDEVLCPGSGITVYSGFVGASALGEKGVLSEVVGKRAANRFLNEIRYGVSFDTHMGDQILIFAALASGKTSFTVPSISSHMSTNMLLLSKFLGVDFCVEKKGEKYFVEVEGVGFKKEEEK